jgi:two-component system, LytTR family, sensor histidine kinase AlgZ
MGRLWILLGVNVATVVVFPLLSLGGGYGDWRGWITAIVYTNVTGISAVLLGPAVVEWFTRRHLPLIAAVAATTVLFAAAGSLAAQAVLARAGIEGSRLFWSHYLHTLRSTLLFSMVFGLGAFSYASMRQRLRLVEQQLHDKEVAEERTRKLAAEARLRSLESRLHPHFLFNTLNSISALIAVDPTRAEQIVGRLAALLRASLETTSQSLIPLERELAMVEDYLDIERARFGDRLRGRVDVPADLRDAQVPPLSVQSLVENAVKHGITPERSGGEVCVSASARNGQLTVAVADTGAGFDLSAIDAGHGLDSLVGRLDALFSSRGHLAVSRRDGRCVVEMVLPRS